MPKRVIDGEAIWRSGKILRLKPQERAEYTWLLPLPRSDGCRVGRCREGITYVEQRGHSHRRARGSTADVGYFLRSGITTRGYEVARHRVLKALKLLEAKMVQETQICNSVRI